LGWPFYCGAGAVRPRMMITFLSSCGEGESMSSLSDIMSFAYRRDTPAHAVLAERCGILIAIRHSAYLSVLPVGDVRKRVLKMNINLSAAAS
jgi:hypothetical protein